MAKLNQIVAVVGGKKTESQRKLTELHKLSQKRELFDGMTREYRSLDDEGEGMPTEVKKLQMIVSEVVKDACTEMVEFMDAVSCLDNSNCFAQADVVVNGTVIASGLPVTHLIFLEKRLVDLETFIVKLPELGALEEWEWCDETNCFRSKPVQTMRTKKVPRNHVKSEATDRHPAQVEMYYEDVQVGTWTQTKFSGAIPSKKKSDMIQRVRALKEAVKCAREEANGSEASRKDYAQEVMNFIFG